MLEQLAAALGVKSTNLAAGFLGALVSLRFLNEAKTWPARVIMALCGTICAVFAAPALIDYFLSGASARVESGLTFAVGLFGMTATGSFIAAIRELKIAEHISTWFKKPGA